MRSGRLTRQVALFAGGVAIVGMGTLTACGGTARKPRRARPPPRARARRRRLPPRRPSRPAAPTLSPLGQRHPRRPPRCPATSSPAAAGNSAGRRPSAAVTATDRDSVIRFTHTDAVVLLALFGASTLLAADLRGHSRSAPADVGAFPVPGATITGPYASLLASSVDLGPARSAHVQLTASLHGKNRPSMLMHWAEQQGLSVRWRAGRFLAILEGGPEERGGRAGRRRP